MDGNNRSGRYLDEALTQVSVEGELLREVDSTQETIRVVIEEGHEIEIKPAPKLKPLLTFEGYVPDGWKDAIYESLR